jgi:hypothetical protein
LSRRAATASADLDRAKQASFDASARDRAVASARIVLRIVVDNPTCFTPGAVAHAEAKVSQTSS